MVSDRRRPNSSATRIINDSTALTGKATIAKDFRDMPICGTSCEGSAKAANGIEPSVCNSMAASVTFLVLPDELQFDAQRDKLVADAKALAEQAKLRAMPVGLAAKKSKATAAWKLDGNNAEAVTVVLYNHLRVVERWTFADGKPTDADRKAILAAIEKEVPGRK